MAKTGHGDSHLGQSRYGRGIRRDPALLLHALRFALRQRGVPYQWGGTTRAGGFDCSGLVYAAYRQAGYMGIGRTTYDQLKQGRAVGQGQLQPGDIVFPEAGHEGLYIGRGLVLEAPHTGDHVKLIPLAQFGFWQARRLIGGGGGIIPPRGIAGQTGVGLPIRSQNPADRLPHPAFMFQARQLQKEQAKFQQQFLQQQNQFAQQQKQQAALTKQQNLSQTIQQEAQQRTLAGQQAQQGLSSGLGATATSSPVSDLFAQRQSKVNSLRAQALARAGIS